MRTIATRRIFSPAGTRTIKKDRLNSKRNDVQKILSRKQEKDANHKEDVSVSGAKRNTMSTMLDEKQGIIGMTWEKHLENAGLTKEDITGIKSGNPNILIIGIGLLVVFMLLKK